MKKNNIICKNSMRIVAVLLTIIIAFMSGNCAMMVKAADVNEYAAVFNASYYAAHNSDVVAVYGNEPEALLSHFITYGMSEGRQGNEEFNVQAYKERYADLRAVFGDNLKNYYIHYMSHGKNEGRNAKPEAIKKTTVNATPVSNNTPVVTGDGPTSEIASYYDRAVFVGDSIMVGYRNYSLNTALASAHYSDFLANVSYSLYNAFTAVTPNSLHPTYAGAKRYVWESIEMMDVDRVFIFFGTNELVGIAPESIIPQYQKFIANIQQAKPGIEIHIISMTPVYSTTNNGCLNNDGVNALNILLAQMCAENGYGYVNIHDAMMDESGAMNPVYSSDKYVHCNNSAYANVWEPIFQNYASERLH